MLPTVERALKVTVKDEDSHEGGLGFRFDADAYPGNAGNANNLLSPLSIVSGLGDYLQRLLVVLVPVLAGGHAVTVVAPGSV